MRDLPAAVVPGIEGIADYTRRERVVATRDQAGRGFRLIITDMH